MKIALVTFYAVTNIGDRIVTDTVKWFLRNHEVEIVDLNARYAYRFTGLAGKLERRIASAFVRRTTPAQRYAYFERCIRGKDLVLFGGGQVLDMAYTDCASGIQMIVSLAEKYRVPVAFHAVGLAGDDYDGRRADSLRRALGSPMVVSVSVRERLDDVKNRLVSADRRVDLVADTAVWSAQAYQVAPRKYRFPAVRVGINIVRQEMLRGYYGLPEDSEVLIEGYATLYRRMTDRGCDCYFFTNGVPADMKTVEAVRSRLQLGEDRIVRMGDRNGGRDFLVMLREFDFVVSSRLHTSICCYSLRLPTVALPWDDKFLEFYRSSCQEQWCYGTCHYDVEALWTLVDRRLREEPQMEYCDTFRQSVVGSLRSLLLTVRFTSLSGEEVDGFFVRTAADFGVFSDEAARRAFALKLSANARFVVCRDESGSIVAMVAAYVNRPPLCYVSHVSVAEEYKGRGLLGRMLRCLETEARASGCRYVRLEVALHNRRARCAYSRYGFRDDGEATDHSVYMRKDLK